MSHTGGTSIFAPLFTLCGTQEECPFTNTEILSRHHHTDWYSGVQIILQLSRQLEDGILLTKQCDSNISTVYLFASSSAFCSFRTHFCWKQSLHPISYCVERLPSHNVCCNVLKCNDHVYQQH